MLGRFSHNYLKRESLWQPVLLAAVAQMEDVHGEDGVGVHAFAPRELGQVYRLDDGSELRPQVVRYFPNHLQIPVPARLAWSSHARLLALISVPWLLVYLTLTVLR